MNNSFFIAGSMYLGWILSPEALVLVSNYAGLGGTFAPLALLAALAISYLGVVLTRTQPKQAKSSTGMELIQTSTNLAARSALVIFISTGMLVTAGFTFNETFLYWFPNFGFSAVLLSFVLIIHLLGDKIVKTSQKIFSSLTALCLLTIIAAGLLTNSEIAAQPIHLATTAPSAYTLSFLFGGLFFFLGAYQLQTERLSFAQIFLIVATGVVVLIFWQIIAIKHVPQVKLAESTIPYILVAREVLGQTGRILMGLAIISGTCAATNYFMSLATGAGSALIVNVPSFSPRRKSLIKRLLSLLFTIIIGICMASGLAGEAHLELYIYGALLLWLLSSGIQILRGVLQLQKASPLKNFLRYLTPAIFFTSFLYLTLIHSEFVALVIFIIIALVFSSVFTSAMFLLGKKYNQQPIQRGDTQ